MAESGLRRRAAIDPKRTLVGCAVMSEPDRVPTRLEALSPPEYRRSRLPPRTRAHPGLTSDLEAPQGADVHTAGRLTRRETSAESLARSAASCRQSCSLELSAGQQNGAPTLARSSRCLFRLVGRRNSWTMRHVPGIEIVYSVLLWYPVPRCLDFAKIGRAHV